MSASLVIARWAADPVAFVREVFNAEPDAWQIEALRAVAREPRVAMSACKGPGKSCLLAWIIWWFLLTRENANILALSITKDNLKDGLWKELGVWRNKSPILKKAFLKGGDRIKSSDPERGDIWWCSARSFSKASDAEQQANSLAGLHAEHVMIVLDEVGDFPEGVFSAAEAIFANEVDAHLVVAGNPTSPSGPLYRVMGEDADKWHCIHITGDPLDPLRSPRISIPWAQGEIDRWGRDNPWVMVNILGQFPPAGADQLISINLVTAAMSRDVPYLAIRDAAIVWGVDPSRSLASGADEASLCKRQGNVCRRFTTWRGLDGTKMGDAIGRMILEDNKKGEAPDAIFVDVGGVGASCYDRLCALGFGDIVHPVDFGGSADDGRFLNKRAEIWWLMMEWLKNMPACIPQDQVLRAELPSPKFVFTNSTKQTKFKLESKEDMKARGTRSPNRADSLALTFTAPVVSLSREMPDSIHMNTSALTEYDPLEGF